MNKQLSLREIQLEELDILKHVVKIINKNKLNYSLCGGTLLGAVRHKGFIPWDDDIDIAMPRPDYEKLVKIFKKENKNKNLELQCYENGTLFQPFAKIVNTSIEIKDNSICDQEKRYLWIDIFPLDGLSQDDKELFRDYNRCKKIARLLYINHYSVLKDRHSPFVKKIIKLLIKPYAMLYNGESILRIAKKYDYNTSKYVGGIVWGYGPQERNKKADLDNYIDWEFENCRFKIFKGYDSYLKGLYNDYMKLPPKEKRIIHGIIAWKTKK